MIQRKLTIKRLAVYTLLIAILIGSNVGTVYLTNLIDSNNDLTVEVEKLEQKNETLMEQNIQLKVGVQELSEPKK